jgi:hypothetical protein
VRKQYIALVAVFLLMMTFNLTATHRARRVAAEVSRHDDRQMQAEAVVYEFNRITKELNEMKAKADLVRRIDNQIDVAAILAEISHLVDESIVLNKVELTAEPIEAPQTTERTKGASVRAASQSAGAQEPVSLGNVKLRVTLAGVAIQPSRVADLVCRLDESAYFQQVRPSFYNKAKIRAGGARVASQQVGKTGDAPEMLDVTTFEITCYLANFKETETQ